MESEHPMSLGDQVEAAYMAAERMSMRVTKDSPAGAKVFQYPLKFKVSVLCLQHHGISLELIISENNIVWAVWWCN